VELKARTEARSRKAIVWGIAAAIGIAVGLMELPRIGRLKTVTGAVLAADPDPRKQLPIPNVEIVGNVRGITVSARSDASGFFRLTWPAALWYGQTVVLQFRLAGYEPLVMTEPLTHDLFIARMAPVAAVRPVAASAHETTLTNLRVRYSVKSTNTTDVGSMADTFEVVNTSNIPCHGRATCSPDGRWAASLGSFHKDAGSGQEFRYARVSCVAGPCPFTRIESDAFSRGGQQIGGTVLAWSDTVTFLVEADVVRTALSDMIRQSYPAIFGRTFTFTLPPGGEGPCILAEVDGSEIVYPLGPARILTWATCNLQTTADRSKLYSCTLKPGYRFR
jgi:hypothetical protein